MPDSLPTISPRKRVRWQVSLRMLLLLMTLVGIGLVIYRRPWVEASEYDYKWGPVTETTTYRRDWRGRKVRHGSRTLVTLGLLETEEIYHDGQQLRSRRYDSKGRLVEETNSVYDRAGVRRVEQLGDGNVWVERIPYLNDKIHGTWERIVDRRDGLAGKGSMQVALGMFHGGAESPRNPVRLLETWQQSKLHGLCTWQTLSGETLNTAQYVDGEFAEWNGRPVVAQFREWIEQVAPHNQSLLALVREGGTGKWEKPNGWGVLYARLTNADYVNIMSDELLPETFHLRADQQSFAAALCEFAVTNGYCLSYRYGVLWLTPLTDAGSVYGDRTGIDRVAFEPGSEQELVWQAEVELYESNWQLRSLLTHITQDSGIELDLSQLPPDVPATAQGDPGDLLWKLSRRDLFGLVLYRLGLRCEQQGNKLIISRRWEPPAAPDPPAVSPPGQVDPRDPFG